MASSISDYETQTALHFRNLHESDPGAYGNNQVRKRLAELGVGLVLVPNAAAYHFADGTVDVHHVLGFGNNIYSSNTTQLPLGSEGVGVIRARVHTPTELENMPGVDVLNGPKLREIGASKWRQYELAHEFMPPTILADTTLESDMSTLLGKTFVVKADMSQLSRDCVVTGRSEVRTTVMAMQAELQARTNRTNHKVLVQTFAPGNTWQGLEGRTEYARTLLERSRSQELRVYCYVTDQDADLPFQAKYYATGRAFRDAEDKWAEIDQDTVPQRVWGIADTVSKRLLTAAGVHGGYFAIDFIQTVLPGQGKTDLLIREINIRDPMMVTDEEGVEDALIQRHMLAELIERLSKR